MPLSCAEMRTSRKCEKYLNARLQAEPRVTCDSGARINRSSYSVTDLQSRGDAYEQFRAVFGCLRSGQSLPRRHENTVVRTRKPDIAARVLRTTPVDLPVTNSAREARPILEFHRLPRRV
jgi:hypothetical protein